MRKSLSIRKRNARCFSLFINALFLAAFIFCRPQLPADWLERAVSTALTRTYGQTIAVSGIHIQDWRHITADTLQILGAHKQPLATASGCALEVRTVRFSPRFEMDIFLRLEGVTLYRDFYKRSAAARGFWPSLMRKPLLIDDLCVRTKLRLRETLLEVLDCESQHVQIHGAMHFYQNGLIHNGIETMLTPYMVLRAIF